MTASEFRHGVPVVHGAMAANRRPVDLLRIHNPREVRFSKRYLEGKLFLDITDEFLDDAVADPWVYAEERLDAQARIIAGHNLDGSPV